MMISSRQITPLVLVTFLSACAQQGEPFGGIFGQKEPEPATDVVEEAVIAPDEAAEETVPVAVGAGGATADTLDTTTEAEKQAVTSVSVPTSGLLGETVASLGDPTKPGFWLKTPLVKAETEGRIERDGGAVAQVTLIPLDGEATSGSQISLSAMRALDFSLTDLAVLKVYSN